MRNETHSLTVFPVGLLVENRPCLVAGSGKVAAHKTRLLLDAKANVTVVGPDADDEIKTLAAAKSINYIQREFKDSDIKGAFLVFAATNSKTANSHIIKCCREQNILCCTVDGNWTSSDFVTPAIIRKNGLTLSISSGGKSCRRTKLVKENLSRHMNMAASADLIVIGTSDQYIPAQRLDKFSLSGTRMDATGKMLMQVWGIHEFMLLNTGSRIEFLGVVSEEEVLVDLLKRVMAFTHLKKEEYYIKRGFEAFEHSALASAGLCAQPPRDSQVIARTKEALEYSTAREWAGSMIQEWIGAALHISGEIIQITEPLLIKPDMEKAMKLSKMVVAEHKAIYDKIVRSFQRDNRA